MIDTYRVTVAITEDLDNAPSFNMTSDNLSRAQLDGFLCMAGGFYDNMCAQTPEHCESDRLEDPDAEQKP